MKRNVLIILSVVAIASAMIGFSYAQEDMKLIRTIKGNGYTIQEYETENGSHAVISGGDN